MALTPLQRKFVLRWYSSFPSEKEEMFFELAKQRLMEQGGNAGEVPKGDDPMPRVGKVNAYLQEAEDSVPPMIVQHTDKSNKPTPSTKRGVPFKEGETLPNKNTRMVKRMEPHLIEGKDMTPAESPSTDMTVPVTEGKVIASIVDPQVKTGRGKKASDIKVEVE